MIEKYVKTNFKSYEDFTQNCKINVPENFNFGFDIVDEIADEKPDKTAMIWCNETDDEKVWTFKDMKERSAQTANMLSFLGIKKGDTVMLMLKRHYEFWFCIVALHKIGAVAVPATHLLTVKDIVYRINAANIKTIIAAADERIVSAINEAKTATPILQNLISVQGHVEGWHDYSKELCRFSSYFPRPTGAEASANEDPFLMYFTSGTAGYPKMVYHNFTYPLGHIITAKFWQNLNSDSLHFTVADTGWGKAAWGKIYGQWICEAIVFVYDYERIHYDKLIEKIAKYGVTSFCAPPTVYRHIIKEDISKYDLSKLKYAETAGEPLNPEVFYKFKDMTGLELKEGFGQTETTLIIATFPWVKSIPGSLGKSSAGWDIDVVDEEGKSCPPNQEGYLVVRTDKKLPVGLFCGYYKTPELTRSVWRNGIYNTNDRVYRDENGYFWFVGRADDVIKSSGYRIGPFEVESALIEHPAVLECAITGVPDEERGEIVKATVILAKGYEANDALAEELQEYVKKTTAPYKYPRLIEFVSELPKTISGKIRRVTIREQDKVK
ncbi:MAG: AMP-binding protein [Elusimicrobiota bacterium]|nr:AMP-binding protein [Elusimicrobiota bacterium]